MSFRTVSAASWPTVQTLFACHPCPNGGWPVTYAHPQSFHDQRWPPLLPCRYFVQYPSAYAPRLYTYQSYNPFGTHIRPMGFSSGAYLPNRTTVVIRSPVPFSQASLPLSVRVASPVSQEPSKLSIYTSIQDGLCEADRSLISLGKIICNIETTGSTYIFGANAQPAHEAWMERIQNRIDTMRANSKAIAKDYSPAINQFIESGIVGLENRMKEFRERIANFPKKPEPVLVVREEVAFNPSAISDPGNLGQESTALMLRTPQPLPQIVEEQRQTAEERGMPNQGATALVQPDPQVEDGGTATVAGRQLTQRQEQSAALMHEIRALSEESFFASMDKKQKNTALNVVFSRFDRAIKLEIYKGLGKEKGKSGGAAEAYGREYFADDIGAVLKLLGKNT